MPHAVDLTTLTDLKNYISPDLSKTTASDAVLSKTITAVSQGINRVLSRNLEVRLRAEVRNGNGRGQIRPLVYPILSVASVVITPQGGSPGTTITPNGNGSTPSLVFDKWFITLQSGYFCNTFPYGAQNVTLNYTAGFLTPGQVQVMILPAWAASAAVIQNQQMQIGGFYYQAVNSGTTGIGTAFSQVRNSLTNDNGVMWLCLGAVPVPPADADFVPDDLQQACLQQSALLFKNRTRVGDTGSGVGPDRINYFLKDAHPSTVELVMRHKEVFPTDGMGPV